MILAGLIGIILIEIYAAVMQREFQNTDNQVGKGFAVLGIYLFVVTYCAFSRVVHPPFPTCSRNPFHLHSSRLVLIPTLTYPRLWQSDGMLNSTTWLYGAEVLPLNLRSKVMGLAAASHFIVNVGSMFPRVWTFPSTPL